MTTSEEITTQHTATLLRDLLNRVYERSTSEMLRVKSETGLSMPQMFAMHMLRASGTLSISAIAEKLELSLAAGSHLVDRLVQQRLVERLEDPMDRRHKRVSLAPSGCELMDRLAAARMGEIDQIVAALPPELNAQFTQVLEQVLVRLAERQTKE